MSAAALDRNIAIDQKEGCLMFFSSVGGNQCEELTFKSSTMGENHGSHLFKMGIDTVMDSSLNHLF
jgi:hypothetical protein